MADVVNTNDPILIVAYLEIVTLIGPNTTTINNLGSLADILLHNQNLVVKTAAIKAIYA